MSLSPLRKLLQGLLAMIGVTFVLIGIILLLSGFNAYINPDVPDAEPFEQLLLAMGFLGVPFSGMLFYKARKSLRTGDTRYGLPDAPGHSFLLSMLAITTVILTTGAFVIVLTVF